MYPGIMAERKHLHSLLYPLFLNGDRYWQRLMSNQSVSVAASRSQSRVSTVSTSFQKPSLSISTSFKARSSLTSLHGR